MFLMFSLFLMLVKVVEGEWVGKRVDERVVRWVIDVLVEDLDFFFLY